MPRFFFHLYNDMITTDEEGRELADVATARAVAVDEVRAVMTDEVLKGRLTLSHRIVVADESGHVVATVRYADAVDVKA
jgi:hypothetical protein